MNHEKMQELIFALYDGELNDSRQRQEAESHLAACVDCHELYNGWTESSKELFKKTSVASSEFFVRQTMSRIRSESRPRSAGAGIFLRWLVPALSLAVVSFVMVRPYSAVGTPDSFLNVPGNFEMEILGGHGPDLNETLGFILGEE